MISAVACQTELSGVMSFARPAIQRPISVER